MSDLAFRLAALIQLAVLLGCGLGWHTAHREQIPRHAWLVGWAYGYTLAVVAAVITLNAILAEHLTVGLRVLVVLLAPATSRVTAMTVHAARTAAAEARAVLAWVDALDALEPCPDPGCTQQRAEIRRIAGRRT